MQNESGVGSRDVSRGTNSWNGSGTIVTDPVYNKTGAGGEACSFRIAVNQHHKPTLFIRINVYGGNASMCKKFLVKKGDFVVVDGELMNRQGRDEVLTEIRCHELVIQNRERD